MKLCQSQQEVEGAVSSLRKLADAGSSWGTKHGFADLLAQSTIHHYPSFLSFLSISFLQRLNWYIALGLWDLKHSKLCDLFLSRSQGLERLPEEVEEGEGVATESQEWIWRWIDLYSYILPFIRFLLGKCHVSLMTNRFVELLSTEVWYCQCCAFFSVGRWTWYSDLLHQATWVKGLARVCSGWMKSPTRLRRCRVSLVTLLGHLHGTGSSTASRLNKIKQDRNVDQCRHRRTDNVSRGFADTQLHPIATYPHHPQPYLSDYDLIWFNMKLFQRIPVPV